MSWRPTAGGGWGVRSAPWLAAAVLAGLAGAAEPPATAPTDSGTDVRVTARAEPNSVPIGTPFRYVVEISAPKNAELTVPMPAGTLGEFSIVDFGSTAPKADGNRVVTAHWFSLVAYRAGEKRIPRFSVSYKLPGGEAQTAESEEVPVTIRSLVSGDPAATDIRDIAPPLPAPRAWNSRMLAAAAGLAATALGACLYWARKRWRRATPAPAPPSPDQVALKELARLAARELPRLGRYEEYYVALSNIVRQYLEDRFGLHAPEMTTEEFLAAAQRDRRLTEAHRVLLAGFLAEADLVKFARHVPAPQDAERAGTAARRFVQETGLRTPGAEERRAAA